MTVEDYLNMLYTVRQRCIHVGRCIQEWKHHSYTGLPIVAPFDTRVTPDNVSIAIAFSESGYISVQVPAKLFEVGTDGAIRTWVTQQNQLHQDRLNEIISAEKASHRFGEITLLKELQCKYPGETV